MAEKDYKTKIVIEGDSKGAESAISSADSALARFGRSAVRISGAIGRALSVFSRLTWVVSSYQVLVEGVKRLQQRLQGSAAAARELSDAMERTAIAAQSSLNAAEYKRVNKELEEANRLERQRNDILAQRRTIGRDLEDANLALAREREIAALDPESGTYAADKAAIERRYSLKGAETAMRRTREDNADERSRLYREADRLDRQAAEKEVVYARQNSIVDRGVERASRLYREARAVAPEDSDARKAAEDKAQEADRQWRQDHAEAVKIRESMDALRKEAEALRARAANIPSGVAARRNFEAAQLRDANQRREDEAKARRLDEAQRRDVADFSRGLETKAAEAEWKRAFDAATPAGKSRMLAEREAAASGDMQTLRAALDAEIAKDAGARDVRRIAELKSGIDDAQRRMLDARGERESLDLQARRSFGSSLSGALQSVVPSGNRLTAMGLGAGPGIGRVQAQMAESLRTLVRQGQAQIDALKAIGEDSQAVYGD